MRKLMVALGAVCLLSGTAWAASIEGVMKEYIKHTKVIALMDGNSYAVPPDVTIPAEVVAGTKVWITTDDDDATKVTAVSPK